MIRLLPVSWIVGIIFALFILYLKVQMKYLEEDNRLLGIHACTLVWSLPLILVRRDY